MFEKVKNSLISKIISINKDPVDNNKKVEQDDTASIFPSDVLESPNIFNSHLIDDYEILSALDEAKSQGADDISIAPKGSMALINDTKTTVQKEEPDPFIKLSGASLDAANEFLSENQVGSIIESLAEFSENNLDINDAKFDIQSNGEIVVSFPQGDVVLKIDNNGNIDKLESQITKNDDGSYAQLYEYLDESGNKITRQIDYDSNGRINSSDITIADSGGNEIRKENYNEKGEITYSKTTDYLFDMSSTKETYYKDNKKVSETIIGLGGSSVENKLYDENGILSSSVLTNYSTGNIPQDKTESHYKDGQIVSKISEKYSDNGEKLKNKKEEYYEDGIKKTEISSDYNEKGKLSYVYETHYQGEEINYAKSSYYNEDGVLYAQSEGIYKDNYPVSTTRTSFDENGNTFIVEINDRNTIVKNTEIYKEADGSTREIVTSYDESGNVVKTVTLSDAAGNETEKITTLTALNSDAINSMQPNQRSAINKLLSENDMSGAVFDINKYGEIVVTFPDVDKGSVKIDSNGKISKLQTNSTKNADGSYSVSYLEQDKKGNTYTRTIEFDSQRRVDNLKYADKNYEFSFSYNKCNSYNGSYCETNNTALRVFDEKDAQNTGDICRLDDSGKIGIRLEDGSIQELNISEKTLNRLFPEDSALRFNQGRAGDCYLVSSIYSLLSNPNTRGSILSCYSENEDASVTVKLPNGSVSFTLKPGKTTGDYVDPATLVNGCEGVKMLQHLCGLQIVKNKQEEFNNEKYNESLSDEEVYNQFKSLYGDPEDESEEYRARGDGGRANEIYELFGIDTTGTMTFGTEEQVRNAYSSEEEYRENVCGCTEDIKELLLNPENWDNYVFGAGSIPFNTNNPLIATGHAYSIRPYQTETGEIRFEVTNPWYTDNHFSITFEELEKNYLSLFFAKVK